MNIRAQVRAPDGAIKLEGLVDAGTGQNTANGEGAAEVTFADCGCVNVDRSVDWLWLTAHDRPFWAGPVTNVVEVGFTDDGETSRQFTVQAGTIPVLLDQTVRETFSRAGDVGNLARTLIRDSWLTFDVALVPQGPVVTWEWTEPRYLAFVLDELTVAGYRWVSWLDRLLIGEVGDLDARLPLLSESTVEAAPQVQHPVGYRRAVVTAKDSDGETIWGSFGSGGPELIVALDTQPDPSELPRIARRYVVRDDPVRVVAELDMGSGVWDLAELIPGRRFVAVASECWSGDSMVLESVSWNVTTVDGTDGPIRGLSVVAVAVPERLSPAL